MTTATKQRGAYLTLTVEELADELRCGVTRAKELLREEVIPSVLVGGTLRRVRRNDLEAYVKSLPHSKPGASNAEPGES